MSYLPFAVKGFFDNGGQRLFVARVTRPNAAAAELTLATDGADLVLEAIGPGNLDGRLFVRVHPRQPDALGRPDSGRRPDPNRVPIQVLYYATPPPLPLVDPFDRGSCATPTAASRTRRRTGTTSRADPLSATTWSPRCRARSC